MGWLRDYVDLSGLTTDEIADKLASLGFPVESVERRPQLHGVIAGRIKSLVKHPNADRLQLCVLDVGRASPLTIATAATNVAQGQIVPVATIGAQLVGLTIAPRKMRGVDSEGMLCSAAELGLEASWFEDGILQLDDDLPLGTDVIAFYGLSDDVLDVEVTSNRVDVLSMIGVAGELAAGLRRPLQEAVVRIPIPTSSTHDATCGDLRITIESPDCRRFVAQRFSNVRVGPAPAWMRLRLALAGQRPINNVVDVSNFVMLEVGQPQHAYDVERLAGRHLIARDARDGEILRTLDGEERTLTPLALVIADEEQAQGLAGLKGGAASEITPATREIVFESATFTGARVRRMSVAQGFRSDASSRHEKGLPLALAEAGAARAAELLVALGATPAPACAVGVGVPPPPTIAVTSQEVRGLLGIEISQEEAEGGLRALGFTVRDERWRTSLESESEATYIVQPPYRRTDVSIAADVIEEIARIVGYDRIEAQLPPVLGHAISSAPYEQEAAVANAFATYGYREINSLALQPSGVHETFERAGITAPEPVEIMNPLSEDQRFLRFSLLPGLLQLAARHQHEAPLRFFEIGHVFERAAAVPMETAMVAWMLVAPPIEEPAWRDSGFLEFKGDAAAALRAITGRDADAVTTQLQGLHPGKTASLLIEGKDAATIGAVDPRLLAAFGLEARLYAGVARLGDIPTYRLPRFVAPSRFPVIERDLALLVDPEIPAHEIVHAITAGSDGVLRDVNVFDEYRGPQVGENRKSIAVRVTLGRTDATLTDSEAEACVTQILASLRERVGAQIRS
ncbi:MAG TPA: phenylalanine--tRNA ligase subunit beta [Candidatus Acidoferrales bacterium]|nr:phenylalanine--tRNA ligase subunit beta [Candidatus Acidoferrales bacterium]